MFEMILSLEKEKFSIDELEKVVSQKKYNNAKIWVAICENQRLTEDFIARHVDDVAWHLIPGDHPLTPKFIKKFAFMLDRDKVSTYQNLPISFIKKHANWVDWWYISRYQKLPEKFIEKHADRVYWSQISAYQDLSLEFIDRHQDKLNWDYIGSNQKLPVWFIEKHLDKLEIGTIIMYQKLPGWFIEKYVNPIFWRRVAYYQKLPKWFIKKYSDKLDLNIIQDSWHYKSEEEKKKIIMETGLHECHEDYFVAYKAVRLNDQSLYDARHRYKKGKTYTAWADVTDETFSFGLGCGTYDMAEKLGKIHAGKFMHKIKRVKVRYKDVARVINHGNIIRAFRITILD